LSEPTGDVPGPDRDLRHGDGQVPRRLTERTYAKTIYHTVIDGENWSGIQITTAAGVTAIVDMLAAGQLPASGLLKMESVDYEQFLKNRFGKYYA
jgi:saccharopine dehydrogenase-like NADP-dependent oxidoreductase